MRFSYAAFSFYALSVLSSTNAFLSPQTRSKAITSLAAGGGGMGVNLDDILNEMSKGEEPQQPGEEPQQPEEQPKKPVLGPQAPVDPLVDEPVVFMTQDGKVGRNRDADKIANTADMYFAQLKLDSKIRKRAFLQGDTETSNKVFGDERVQKLPDELAKNPFVKANLNRTKADDTLGTSAEESLGPFIFTAQDKPVTAEEKRNSGISYKQKLMEKKKKFSTSPEPQPAKDEAATPPPPPVTAVSTPAQQPAKEETATPPPPPPVTVVSASTQPAEEAATPPPPLVTAVSTPTQPPPVQQQQTTTDASFLHIIDEAMQLYNDAVSAKNVDGVLIPLRSTLQKAVKEMEKDTSEEESYDPLSPSIECIQGALHMYNNADVNERKNLLQPLRGALLSAVKKIEEVANE